MPTLPIIDVKTDPLDALLYGLGLRLSSLSKGDNETYHNLVKDKELAIQFKSGDDVARYYRFVDGHFGQALILKTPRRACDYSPKATSQVL